MTTPLPPIIPTEDFWARQANAQRHSFEGAPYGIPIQITANDEAVLAAARLSAGRYSLANERRGKPIRIQCVVVDRGARAPLPVDLTDRLVYSGVGNWIALSAGEWGHSFADLQTRQACIFLSPALAADSRLVSRYFIDH